MLDASAGNSNNPDQTTGLLKKFGAFSVLMYPQPEQLGSRKNYLYFRIINKRRNQMTSSDQHASQVSRSFRGSGGYVNFVVAL